MKIRLKAMKKDSKLCKYVDINVIFYVTFLSITQEWDPINEVSPLSVACCCLV